MVMDGSMYCAGCGMDRTGQTGPCPMCGSTTKVSRPGMLTGKVYQGPSGTSAVGGNTYSSEGPFE